MANRPYYPPYQRTQADTAGAVRKAALLRALAGIAEPGPRLGTDPWGSLQAGLRGALRMGQQQNEDAFKQAELEARQRTEQEARDPIAALRAKRDFLRGVLGRNLTPEEDMRLGGIDAPESKKTLSERIAEAKAAGLGPDQIGQLLGYRVPDQRARTTRLTGEPKEAYSYALANFGPELAGPEDKPNQDMIALVPEIARYDEPPGSLTYVPGMFPGDPDKETVRFEPLTAEDLRHIPDVIKDPVTGEEHKMTPRYRLESITRWRQTQSRDIRAIRSALRRKDVALLKKLEDNGGFSGSEDVKRLARQSRALVLMLSGRLQEMQPEGEQP